MSKTKAIFFDAAGTLFDVEQGVGFHYSRLAKKYGATAPAGTPMTPEILDQRFHETFTKSPPLTFPGLHPSHRTQAEKEWWRHRVKDVFKGFSFPSFDPFFDELYRFFQEGKGEKGRRKERGKDTKEEAAWTLFPETLEVLEHLSQLGYPLGILSNFDSRIYPLLKSLGIFRLFQTITVSSEEGVAKPSRAIFSRALQKTGCLPSDSLYIGDHPHYDVEGAKSAGILALLIDRKRQYQGANIIRDLREIYRYL